MGRIMLTPESKRAEANSAALVASYQLPICLVARTPSGSASLRPFSKPGSIEPLQRRVALGGDETGFVAARHTGNTAPIDESAQVSDDITLLELIVENGMDMRVSGKPAVGDEEACRGEGIGHLLREIGHGGIGADDETELPRSGEGG